MDIETMYNLQGQTAVIIGGARDLGYDMAEILAAAGCEMAAEKLRAAHNCEVLAGALDICDHAQVAAFGDKVQAWRGSVDILVNNAGGGLDLQPTHFFDRDPGHIAQLIDTNLKGILYSCQVFGRKMAERGSGSIINIASIAGLCGRDRRMYEQTGLPEQPIEYAAAKAGVIGATRDLAGLLSPKGVRVNAISPGGFERGQPQAFIDAYSDATPLGRMGRDGVDLKGAALFLASPASAYVTGHNLVVDGGFLMWK
ncbi:MAG: SDR family oxidoreductase [Candidatus Latescibacterota bacterium]|nr:SDR family oxidoreductase [Candidatus Latescibacterota bacterium]